MINDSVREDLAIKISPIQNQMKPIARKSFVPPSYQVKKNVVKSQTSELANKDTNPTLVGFQNKNAQLPEWRLQLQNTVRQRHGTQDQESSGRTESVRQPVSLVTNGATALKAQEVTDAAADQALKPHVLSALKRIEESKQRYMVKEEPIAPIQSNTVKQFPKIFPNKQNESLPKYTVAQSINNYNKPGVLPFTTEVVQEKYNTNKLPPLPIPAKISTSFGRQQINSEGMMFETDELKEISNINMTSQTTYIDSDRNFETTEEFEDLAPLSMRFNAGLFDLLIGSFASLILLSPYMILNGRFFSIEGFFAFLAVCSIVMFTYLTSSIGFTGKTFGMKLFSLEILDAEENELPTLHQAAVSSSVYLLSMALGGIGFLTMTLNEEHRAIHDLLSGTIIVREY